MKVLYLTISALFVCVYSYGQNVDNSKQVEKELAELYYLEDSLARLKAKNVSPLNDNDRIPILKAEDIAAGIKANNGKTQLSKSPAGGELMKWEHESKTAECILKNGGSTGLAHSVLKGQKKFTVKKENDKRALEQCGFKKLPKKQKSKNANGQKKTGKDKTVKNGGGSVITPQKTTTIKCGKNPNTGNNKKQGANANKKGNNSIRKKNIRTVLK